MNVEVLNAKSRVLVIKTGCIQGSILGPILFSIYMSKLDEIIAPHRAVAYADDTYVVVSVEKNKNIKDELESVIARHMEWLSNMGMVCNSSKTELMMMGRMGMEININGESIKSKENMKALGVLIVSELNWNAHAMKVASKCRSSLFFLRYLKKVLSVEEISRVMKAQIVSRITNA